MLFVLEVSRLASNHDYESCVKHSETISWKLDDAMPVGTNLDYTKPFLPEELTLTTQISCSNANERKALNQIAANVYLDLFAFVEEYILATMTQHAFAEMFGDHHAIRALARFVDEEVKHQQLFARYKYAFARGFGLLGVRDAEPNLQEDAESGLKGQRRTNRRACGRAELTVSAERALDKLRHPLGPKAADVLIEQTKKTIGVTTLDEANDLARFAD